MFLQQIINGLTLGSIYALVAIGYTMVYGIIQLINFAHGEVLMMGAYFALMFIALGFFPLPISILLAMMLCAILGMVIEWFAYRPLRRQPRLTALISAVGVSIFLQNLAMLIWGTHPLSFPDPFEGFGIKVLGSRISYLQISIFGIAAVLMILLHLYVQKTRMGRAMRATAEDPETASLMGVPMNRVISLTFAIGSALAAVAGIMIGAYYNSIYPTMGYFIGLKAFAAAVLGGIGNLPGAMAGGLTLGIIEIMAIAFGLPSGYQHAISFIILIVILIVRPTGFFGEKVSEKV